MNPSKKPLDVIGRQSDLRACGHSDDFKLLKGEPPANMLRRKEKWEAKRCPACVAAADKLRKEESAKLRAEREQKFRLPTGSIFNATYDATTEKWVGTLTTPDGMFEGKCDGVHGLMRWLGRQWRGRQEYGCVPRAKTKEESLSRGWQEFEQRQKAGLADRPYTACPACGCPVGEPYHTKPASVPA